MGLKTGVTLWLDCTGEQSRSVKFEEWLKEISTTVIHDTFDLVEARIVPEALIVEVSLVKFDRAAIVAEHELLEGHEAHIPRITLFVGNESGDLVGSLNHGTVLELPDASVNL